GGVRGQLRGFRSDAPDLKRTNTQALWHSGARELVVAGASHARQREGLGAADADHVGPLERLYQPHRLRVERELAAEPLPPARSILRLVHSAVEVVPVQVRRDLLLVRAGEELVQRASADVELDCAESGETDLDRIEELLHRSPETAADRPAS